MNPFPNITWDNALRLVVDAFLIGVGWSAGVWMFAQLMTARPFGRAPKQ